MNHLPSLQQVTLLLDTMGDPIFLKDREHTWIYVNQAFASMVGKPINELVGKNDAHYMPREVYEVFCREDDWVLDTGEVSHQEEDIQPPAGAKRRLLTKKTRIEWEGQQFVFGIIRDVTELHRNQRLTQLGELSAALFHELATPLSVMDHHVRTMEAKLAGQLVTAVDVMRFVTHMGKTRDRFMTTINGIRAFAHGDKNSFSRDVTLQELVDEARELSAFRMKGQQVALQVAEVPMITLRARPGQLAQILVNLLHNASDAVQNLAENWVRLEFATGEHHLEIRVVDGGAGIAPEVATKMMNPFFSTKPSHKGTGLGLPFASKIAHEHGGVLSYMSGQEHTTFVLRLPRIT